jgi:hypothetical protein
MQTCSGIEEALFFNVVPCVWVIVYRRLEGTYRLYIQGHESLISLRMKAVRFFETSGTNNPATRNNNAEDLLSQQSRRGA